MMLNTTNYNESGPEEFPLWQPLVAINTFIFVGLLAPSTLFWNLSVFAALVKSKNHNKSLVVLYGSLLLGLCLDKLIICLDQTINVSLAVRYCICYDLLVTFLILPRGFFIVYSNIVVTCQSFLQFLILKGKRKWGHSYQRNFACVALSVFIATFWIILSFIEKVGNAVPSHCQSFCRGSVDNFTSTTQLGSDAILFGSYIVVTLIPSIVTTMVSSVWSLVIFRERFLSRNDTEDAGLNKKILVLPILMVFLLLGNSIISYLLANLSGEILKWAQVEAFFGNWAVFITSIEYFILDILHGWSYPIILLYLNTNLRTNWKRMFKQAKRSNKIHSESDNTTNTNKQYQ